MRPTIQMSDRGDLLINGTVCEMIPPTRKAKKVREQPRPAKRTSTRLVPVKVGKRIVIGETSFRYKRTDAQTKVYYCIKKGCVATVKEHLRTGKIRVDHEVHTCS